MNIVRKMKLNNLGYYQFTEKESIELNIIFKFVENITENYNEIDYIYNTFLNLKEWNIYTKWHSTFYFNDKQECIFEEDHNHQTTYIKRSLFKKFHIFGYNYDQTKTLISLLLEAFYNIKHLSIANRMDVLYNLIEETYKE